MLRAKRRLMSQPPGQLELFDVGPRELIPVSATPAQPGTGPDGETCQSCRHYYVVPGHNGRYRKCKVIEHRWTNGPGTDIKARWPACWLWEPKQE